MEYIPPIRYVAPTKEIRAFNEDRDWIDKLSGTLKAQRGGSWTHAQTIRYLIQMSSITLPLDVANSCGCCLRTIFDEDTRLIPGVEKKCPHCGAAYWAHRDDRKLPEYIEEQVMQGQTDIVERPLGTDQLAARASAAQEAGTARYSITFAWGVTE